MRVVFYLILAFATKFAFSQTPTLAAATVKLDDSENQSLLGNLSEKGERSEHKNTFIQKHNISYSLNFLYGVTLLSNLDLQYDYYPMFSGGEMEVLPSGVSQCTNNIMESRSQSLNFEMKIPLKAKHLNATGGIGLNSMMIKTDGDLLFIGENSGLMSRSDDALLNYDFVHNNDRWSNYREYDNIGNYIYINRLSLALGAEWRNKNDLYFGLSTTLDIRLNTKQAVTEGTNYSLLGVRYYHNDGYHFSNREKVNTYFAGLSNGVKLQAGKGRFGVFCITNLTPLFAQNFFAGEDATLFRDYARRGKGQFWQYGLIVNLANNK